jgi:hypothetical protein
MDTIKMICDESILIVQMKISVLKVTTLTFISSIVMLPGYGIGKYC